jgi:hypothetical protein
MIDASGSFNTVSSALPLATPHEAINAGMREGLWRVKGKSPTREVELTAAGKKHFNSVFYNLTLGGEVVTAAPVRRKVYEVSGMKETDPKTREVEFLWNFEGLDPVVGRYIGIPPTTIWADGVALFELYDDGWRLTKLNIPTAIGGTPDGRVVAGSLPFQPDPEAEAAAAKAVLDEVAPKIEATPWEGTLQSAMGGLRFLTGGSQTLVGMTLFRDGENGLMAQITYGSGRCEAFSDATLDRVVLDTFFFTQSATNEPRCFGRDRRGRASVQQNLKDAIAIRLNGEELEVSWITKGVMGQLIDTATASLTKTGGLL